MKNPCGIFYFLPLEILGKTKLHPWKFYEIVLDPLKMSRPKPSPLEISHYFFSITLGNSNLLLINSWKFHMLFFWYPRKFHIPLPLFNFFLELSIEHPSHMHWMFKTFKVPVAYRGIILLSMVSLSSSHLRRIKKFFNKFFWLTTKFFSGF